MMYCPTCGNKLAPDGGCEACWTVTAHLYADSHNRADAAFLTELHRRYIEFGDTVFDLTGIYPTFKEYDDIWWAENKGGSL